MPRRKTYKATSPIKHLYKMERLLYGEPSKETALALAQASNQEWAMKFGKLRDAYRQLKEFLKAEHPEVPVGQYAFYRSFLLRALARIPNGEPPEYIIESFRIKCGLDEGVMWDILEFFNLASRKNETQTVTKSTT